MYTIESLRAALQDLAETAPAVKASRQAVARRLAYAPSSVHRRSGGTQVRSDNACAGDGAADVLVESRPDTAARRV